MQVIYIYGEPGTGKTTFAKKYSRDNFGEPFITGSSNDPLEGYIGQKCIIMDDTRGEDWKLNDFLKITDNHTNSLAKSRYSNKLLADCKLMIITSVETPDEFLSDMTIKENEPSEQFKRRCDTVMHITKEKITVFTYDSDKHDYVQQAETINPIPMMNFFKDNKHMVQHLIQFAQDLIEDK